MQKYNFCHFHFSLCSWLYIEEKDSRRRHVFIQPLCYIMDRLWQIIRNNAKWQKTTKPKFSILDNFAILSILIFTGVSIKTNQERKIKLIDMTLVFRLPILLLILTRLALYLYRKDKFRFYHKSRKSHANFSNFKEITWCLYVGPNSNHDTKICLIERRCIYNI